MTDPATPRATRFSVMLRDLSRHDLVTSGTNLAIRGLSLASRFVLILVLARALGPATFGIFTLIQTTAIIAVLMLGLEMNAYSRREIIKAEDEETRTRHIRDQLTAAFLLGLGAPVIAYGGVAAGLFPPELAPWISAVILLDLVAQEGTRILYALQRVAAANLAWFVRSSLWVFLMLPLLVWSPEYITLFNVMVTWAAFEILAIGLLAWLLRNLEWRETFRTAIDWGWLAKGVTVAMPFFISSVFLNLLSYLPRYTLFYGQGAHETGIFGLYTGVAVGIVNLVGTTTIPQGISRAVEYYARQGLRALDVEIRTLWIHCGLLVLLLCLGLSVTFPFLLPYIGESSYPMDWPLLLLVEAAFSAQVASMVVQASLYARNLDREILLGTVLAGTLSIPLQFAGVIVAGMHGLAAAMLLSMLLMGGMFLYSDRKTRQSQGKDAA